MCATAPDYNFTSSRPTALHPTTYAPSPRRQTPPHHFQGWLYQSHRTGQYHPHPPQVQKNPLHGTRGPTYQPWTGHHPGSTKQWTQRPLPGAHIPTPLIQPAPSSQPKRPSAGIHPSSFKFELCPSSAKLPVNRYNTDNCASTPSLHTFGTLLCQ